MGIMEALKKRGRPTVAKAEPEMPVNEVETLPIGESKNKESLKEDKQENPIEEYLRSHAETAAAMKYDETRLMVSVDMRLANIEKILEKLLGDEKK